MLNVAVFTSGLLLEEADVVLSRRGTVGLFVQAELANVLIRIASSDS
jgi:hypothetical protein